MSAPRLLAGIALLAAAAIPANAQERTFANSVGMEFILVDPGTMQVAVFKPDCPTPAQDTGLVGGWTEQDLDNCRAMIAAERSDGFAVAIEQPYYLGRFEVTQAQWQAVMQANPSAFGSGTADQSSHPVESITWPQAQAFVAALNRLEGTTAYRLPSEFEWEYACRAGGPGQQSWDEIRRLAVDGGASLGFGYGLTPRDPNLPPPTTAAVGTRAANGWGFFDMLGNVWEWTADGYNEQTFPEPQPPAQAGEHVLKGGGFVSDVKNAICATHAGGPGNGWDVGLRIAMATRGSD